MALNSWNMGGLLSSLPDHGAKTRDELIKWLADEGLAGDITTATWLFLAILGRMLVSHRNMPHASDSFPRQSRSPPIFPLSITISSFPDAPKEVAPTPAITWVLKELLSVVTVVPLTLEAINGKSFAPHCIDEDLHAGLLQQATGTTAVVTETGIKEGKVTESGERSGSFRSGFSYRYSRFKEP